MNKYRASLLVALRAVLEDARKGKFSRSDNGICAQVLNRLIGTDEGRALYHGMESTCYIFSHVWPRWEHYSGESHYPVPGGSIAYYNEDVPHWRGLNLGYRIDLLEFLIRELEKDEADNLPYELETV